jgi:hypothetical protein
MSKFKIGDILVDSYGYRCQVIDVCKDNPKYPYVVRAITGIYKGIWRIGEYGEWWGTGSQTAFQDVTLDIDYMISKMWEELEKKDV